MPRISSVSLSTSSIALATAHLAVLAPLAPAVAASEASQDGVSGTTLSLMAERYPGALLPVASEASDAPYEVTGTVFLADAALEVREFMLVSDMGMCPWCGSADHGMAIEVQLDTPMALEHGTQITVRGMLETLDAADGHTATRMMAAQAL